MRLAVLGAGAVGCAVVELATLYGHTVTGLADSQSAAVDPDGLDIEEVLGRKETSGVVGNEEPEAVLDGAYDVLVEATPTTLGDAQPAFDHVRTALERDCHAVLANKGPVAQRYGELRECERESKGSVRFEATVGGAIPVLSTIEDVGPSHITAIRGVLNGTANFILSRMASEGLAYEHVLAEAQDLGVAETDPAFDVEGTDAALKCVILANVLSERQEVTLEDVTVSGIEQLPVSALELARENGQTIRLLGEVDEAGVRVGPRLVPQHSTLAVGGTRNVVQFETAHAGSLHNAGRGAGGRETATAVMADIRRLSHDRESRPSS